MKVATAIGRAGLRARLTVAGCAALAVLGTLILSACTPSGGTTTSTVSSFTITAPAANTAGATALPDSGSTTVTVTPTQTTTTTVTPAVNPAPNPASSPIPDQAPAAGGGGTAGLQDGLLLVLGAAAIVAGAGAFAYRRRLTRNR